MSAVICAFTFRALVFVVLLIGCTHASVTRAPDAEVRAFALRMIDVLERDDVDGFRDLLSNRIQRRTDDAELRRMFDTWRQLLIPYAQALRDADWTAQSDVVRFRTVGSPPTRLAKVVAERGALRIDEN